MPATYILTHHAYCGMRIPIIDQYQRAEIDEVRQRAARRLRYLRREGYPISTLEKGREWEIQEPEGCVLVPTDCGILHIRAVPVKMYTCYSCEEEFPEGDTHECWTPDEETEGSDEEGEQ